MKKVFKLLDIVAKDENNPEGKHYWDEKLSSIEFPKKKQFDIGDLARDKFKASFEKNPLNDLKEIEFKYELNIKVVPEGKPNFWKWSNESFRKDSYIFSFECKNENEFIEKFEDSLKSHIRFVLSNNKGPEAKLSL